MLRRYAPQHDRFCWLLYKHQTSFPGKVRTSGLSLLLLQNCKGTEKCYNQLGVKFVLMANHYRYGRPTIGVLVGWQVYWTPTPYSYLSPIFRGIIAAAENHGCNLLLACGMGLAADSSDPPRPAWPVKSGDVDFVPVGPWNTDGLIVANPLLSDTRSEYIHELIAKDHPVVFIGNGEGQPSVVADN